MPTTTDEAEPRRINRWVSRAFAAGLVAWLGFAQGGYFPTTWGWVTLVLIWVIAMAVLLQRPRGWRAGPLDWAWCTSAAGLVCWTALSALWSDDVTATGLSASRNLLYLAVVFAILAVARRSSARALADGALIGITLVSVGGLATFLFPDRFGVYAQGISTGRLFYPIGYWNGTGTLAAIGVFLSLGSADEGGRVARAMAGAAVPILFLTLYFSSSRGAVAAGTIAGIILIIVSPARRRTLTMLGIAAPWCAVVLLFAHRSSSLSGLHYSLAAATDGHWVALVTLACVVGCGACFAFTPLPPLASPIRSSSQHPGGRRLAIAATVITALTVVIAGVAALQHLGSVSEVPPAARGDERLSSTSLNGRGELWAVAWRDFLDHPILGSGAGTFEQHWYRDTTRGFDAQWSHSVELGALAELGTLGLALVLAFLLLPLAAFRAIRLAPGAAASFAAYVVFLVHSAVDWDWQIPVVTVAGILCAGVLTVGQQRSEAEAPARVVAAYVAIFAVLGATLLFTVVNLRSQEFLASSESASAQGLWATAAADARAAHRWAPWSYQPLLALGAAEQGAGDDLAARTAYAAAIGKAPERWQLWLSLASASSGRARAEAVEHVLLLNPDSYEVRTFCSVRMKMPCPAPNLAKRS